MNSLKLTTCFLLIFFMSSSCKSQDKKNQNSQTKEANMETINRQPYAAGRFYSDNPEELREDIKQLFLIALPKKNNENVLAIICPHAGYVFSGGIAATSINQINPDKEFENIFVIGSSHTTSFTGASIYNKGNYNTPLGEVKVNIDLANKLINENSLFTFFSIAHEREHSLEVQLPILQYHMKAEFQIVPVIIGSQDKFACKKIAQALAPYFNENNLFIISTDFSHYPTYENACNVDKATAEAITTNNPDEFLNIINSNSKKGISNLATSICGWTSALTLLYITQNIPDIKYTLLEYKNSGDSPYGEKDRVVGYYSIMCTKDVKAQNEKEDEFVLNDEEKKVLLKIARTTIKEYISTGKKSKIDVSEVTDNLKTPCGAFVTLHKHGDLRGCIGRFEPGEPLYIVVQEMAIAAATQDHRFPVVIKNEIPQIDIEISVLTPLKKINSIDEFELGKHGIYIKKGYASGTFLPQVANSTKWNKEEFLGHCARDKAGIGWDGWKNADLYTYEALIFSENELLGD